MTTLNITRSARAAILTLAAVKDAVAAFDQGEVNVVAALEAIRAALAGGAAASPASRRGARQRRRAA